MALTAKQQRFIAEYLVDLNATAAATRAGYSEASAHAQGHRLLKDAEVAAAVAEAQGKRAERVQISQDDVLREVAAVALMQLEAPEVPGAIPFWRPEHKLKALHMAGAHLGMWKQKVEHTGPEGGALVVEIRKYTEGAEECA